MLVLIAERSANTAEALRFAFEEQGHSTLVLDGDRVDEAVSVAWELQIDAAILGQGVTATEVTRMRGRDGFAAAIVVVADMPSAVDRVRMLDAGADDAVSTPFSADEVIARVHAVARRYAGHASARVVVGDLSIGLGLDPILIKGRDVHLTPTEKRIVQYLALRNGRVVSKDAIYDRIYSSRPSDGPEMKIIDVLICKARQKLAKASGGRCYIETEWGQGYRLRDPEECRPPIRNRPQGTSVAELAAARARAAG